MHQTHGQQDPSRSPTRRYLYARYRGGKGGGFPRSTSPHNLKVMHERLLLRKQAELAHQATLDRLAGSCTPGGSFAARERADVQSDLGERGKLMELFEEIGE